MSGMTKGHVTHVTNVRLIAAVNAAVPKKVTRPRESFAANGTFERLPRGMTPPVFAQVATALTAPATLSAPVPSAVHVHVLAQVVLRREPFPAFVARIPVSGRVRFPMNIQRALRRKPLVAHVAFVRPLSAVNSAVLDARSRTREPFSADSAFEWFLAGMTSPVPRQLIAVRTALATLRALVFAAVNVRMQAQGALR